MNRPESALEFNLSTESDVGFPFILFVCVLGSLLAHAGTFFLFRVVYPERVTIPQAATQVSLLTPSSPENIAMLRWIEAEDPAVIANDHLVVPPNLAAVHYEPSFASPRTAPRGAPADASSVVHFPPAKDHLAPLTASRRAEPPAQTATPDKTAMIFSSSLAGRPVVRNPTMIFEHRASQPAERCSLLVGVDAGGDVRFAVPQHASGDPQLDAAARMHLRRLQFAPADAPITWGFVTFTWGNDAFASP